jgi:hypothetical protein
MNARMRGNSTVHRPDASPSVAAQSGVSIEGSSSVLLVDGAGF